MKHLAFLVLLPLTLAITACPSKKKSEVTSKTVYMGDPQNLIKGTSRDTDAWKEGYFEDGETIYLDTIFNFAAYDEVNNKPVSQESIEQENAATKNPDSEDVMSVEFRVKVDSQGKITLINPALQLNILKQFTEHGPIVTVPGEDRTSMALSHISFSKDRSIFTMLINSYAPENKKGMLYLRFYKRPPTIPDLKPNTKYQFTNGPGVYSKWADTISLGLCDLKHQTTINDMIRKSVADWNSALPDANEINYRGVKSTYAPFSDLNQHCIYTINDFYFEPDMRSAGYGITLNTTTTNMMTIIDSDIVLFAKEFEKNGVPMTHPKLRENLYYTVIHELGHMLGLDHQFTPGIPSVMSYEFEVMQIQTYDREAIQELYGQ